MANYRPQLHVFAKMCSGRNDFNYTVVFRNAVAGETGDRTVVW